MEQTLVTVGLVCIVAAIVGGGLKAFNIEVPGIDSVGRQLLLAVFGLLVGGLGLFLSLRGDGVEPRAANGTDSTTAAGSGTSTGTDPGTTAPTDRATTPPDDGSDPDPGPAATATGTGSVGVCRDTAVSVTPLERSEGHAVFDVSVRNEGEATLRLPTLSRVALVDDAGRQWSVDTLETSARGWGVGPEVAPGATVSVDVVFDAPPADAGSARLTISDIAPRDDPFDDCDVTVSGVSLPG